MYVIVSVQDSLGAYCNVSQEVQVRYEAIDLDSFKSQLLQFRDSGDYLSEARLINVLSHYLWNDTHSVELKKLALNES